MVDIGTALFAFAVVALALRNFELAIGCICIGAWCVA